MVYIAKEKAKQNYPINVYTSWRSETKVGIAAKALEYLIQIVVQIVDHL